MAGEIRDATQLEAELLALAAQGPLDPAAVAGIAKRLVTGGGLDHALADLLSGKQSGAARFKLGLAEAPAGPIGTVIWSASVG